MLRKLLKHEFRATARIMVPVYLVLLVTALGANFSTRGILETPYAVLNILGSLLVMAFVVAIMAGVRRQLSADDPAVLQKFAAG